MPEVAHAGEIQTHPGLLSGVDHHGIPDGTAGLGDDPHSGLGKDLQAIGEREVRVARRDSAGRTVTGPGHRQFGRVHSVDLPHANAN